MLMYYVIKIVYVRLCGEGVMGVVGQILMYLKVELCNTVGSLTFV